MLKMKILLALGFASIAGAAVESVPTPRDNPITKAKVELGQQLFFDPRISKTGTVSCNSCHNVMSGGEDSRANSVGVFGKLGGRSAPTVWNAAYLSVQFWDGRAPSLEEQAKGPMTNPVEMGMENHDLIIQKISKIKGYRSQFERIFGKSEPVTIDNVAKAIATYERTLVTTNSPYDRYLNGETNALSLQARRGAKLVSTTGCLSCHSGSNFSGPPLPIGQGFFQKFPVYANAELEAKYGFSKDLGRYEATKDQVDKNFWRVPTLKNIALTAPYFHNGSVATLDEAVRVMGKLQLNKEIPDKDVRDIVAFLESLTGEFPAQKMPRLPTYAGESLVQ